MRKTGFIYVIMAILLAWTVTAVNCSAASDTSGADCGFILNTKCTMCHNLGRICRKVGKKSKSRWQKVIKRMVKYGAPLSKDEQKALAACLYNETNNVRTSCE